MIILSLMENIASKYAYFIVNKQLRLERGERLTINCIDDTLSFANTLSKVAAEVTGVNVQVVYIENGRVKNVGEVEPTLTGSETGRQVMINLTTFPHYSTLSSTSLSAKELQEYRLLSDPFYINRKISTPWAVVYIPTPFWSEFVFGQGGTTDSLYLLLNDMLSLDDNDELHKVQERVLRARCEKLRAYQVDKLYITSPTCDLTLAVNENLRITTSVTTLNNDRTFFPLMPCEDVIIPINADSANGYFKTTYPFRLFDKIYYDATFKVENGKVVNVEVDDNGAINKYINIDNQSSLISEFILCDGYTHSSRVIYSLGIPTLDRMRTSQIVLGGSSPESAIFNSEDELNKSGINSSFVRLELPIGSKESTIKALTKSGEIVTLMEDGIIII